MQGMSPAQPVIVGVDAPAFDDVVAVARHGAPVELLRRGARPRSRAAARSSRRSPPTRGRTTASRPASARSPRCTSRSSGASQLQRSLIRSHAAGSGPEVEREVVRALMLLRLSTLATGRTGVRAETADRLRGDAARAGITPVVHEYGSLGCSGDLAPLAHCALALMGEGPVRDATAHAARRRRRAARGRHRAGRAAREGGPRADQRHRRHARHARAGDRRPARRCSSPPTSPPR